MIGIPVSSLVTETPTVATETSATEAAGHLRRPEVPALVVAGATNPPVESFMSAPVVTVPPDTQVGLAADRMRDAGVGLLPVVDGEGGYRGVVTRECLAPYLSRHRLEVTWEGEPLRLDGSDTPRHE
ncbi:MAG: CBS domain-containing protein [Haloarculaceae archaeon]